MILPSRDRLRYKNSLVRRLPPHFSRVGRGAKIVPKVGLRRIISIRSVPDAHLVMETRVMIGGMNPIYSGGLSCAASRPARGVAVRHSAWSKKSLFHALRGRIGQQHAVRRRHAIARANRPPIANPFQGFPHVQIDRAPEQAVSASIRHQHPAHRIDDHAAAIVNRRHEVDAVVASSGRGTISHLPRGPPDRRTLCPKSGRRRSPLLGAGGSRPSPGKSS